MNPIVDYSALAILAVVVISELRAARQERKDILRPMIEAMREIRDALLIHNGKAKR